MLVFDLAEKFVLVGSLKLGRVRGDVGVARETMWVCWHSLE